MSLRASWQEGYHVRQVVWRAWEVAEAGSVVARGRARLQE